MNRSMNSGLAIIYDEVMKNNEDQDRAIFICDQSSLTCLRSFQKLYLTLLTFIVGHAATRHPETILIKKQVYLTELINYLGCRHVGPWTDLCGQWQMGGPRTPGVLQLNTKYYIYTVGQVDGLSGGYVGYGHIIGIYLCIELAVPVTQNILIIIVVNLISWLTVIWTWNELLLLLQYYSISSIT